MRDQDPGSKPDFSLEGAKDTLEKKRSGDLGKQKASDFDRDDSRGDREMSDSGLDRGDMGMQSSQRQESDQYAGQSRREMDKHLDPSDS